MKKQIGLVLICICLTPTLSFSQDSLSRAEKYWKFLRDPSDNSQNHLFTASFQYMFNPIGKTIGAHGTITNFGINFARFFSNKIIIGVVGDFKLIPGIFSTRIPKQFTADFDKDFITSYADPVDSVSASVVKCAFDQRLPGQVIIGNNVFNFGIMLSLFPQRAGGILVQVKYGSIGYEIHGINGMPLIKDNGYDKIPMTVVGNWVYEISFKPSAFSSNTHIKRFDRDWFSFGNSFVISLFYERLNFKTAEFNGTRVSDMVGGDFMKKYGVDNRFGFKLGIAFY